MSRSLQPQADQAWKIFINLPEELTQLVEFLSFVYVPKGKKELIRLYDRYLHEQDEFPINVESWWSKLFKSGVLASSGSLTMVNRDLVEDVSCHAFARHRAARVCEFLDSNIYVRDWAMLLQARWALYSGDQDWFLGLAQRNRVSRHSTQDYDIVEIVSEGFSQAESFTHLPTDLALILCRRALHLSVNQARYVGGPWAWYQGVAREKQDLKAYQHQIFIRGSKDFPRSSHLKPLSEILEGKFLALDDVRDRLPLKSGHPVFPFASQEFIYVTACYAAGRQKAVMESLIYGHAAMRDWFHWFWEIRTGKSVDLPRQLMRSMADPDYPPMMRFFGYLLLFWAGFEKNLEADAVNSLASAYIDAGYHVFGRELAALHAHLVGEKSLSTPFLSLLAPTKHWEAKLNFLETWLESDLKVQAKRAPEERLVWVLDPKILNVQTKIQKVAKKGGWTKGRLVEFHDLEYKAADFLTEADRKILLELRSADRYHYGFGYGGFRPSRASTLEALKDHPHLYLPDGSKLQLSKEEPCFCVTDLDEALGLTLEPASGEGTNYALKEVDPCHYSLVTFEKDQLDFQSILGPQGMEIPKSEVHRIQAIFTRVAELGLRIESFLPSAAVLEVQRVQSKLAIRLFPQGAGLSLEVWSEIDDITCNHPPGEGPRYLLYGVEGRTIQVERDLNKEKSLYQDLLKLVPQIQHSSAFLPHPGDCLATLEVLKTLPEEHFVLQWPEGKKFQSNTEIQWSDLRVSVFGGKEWFTVETELQLEGAEHLQLSQLLEMQHQQQSRFIKLDDDRYLTLTEDLSKRLQALESASTKKKDGRYELAPLAASVLADSLNLDSQDKAWVLQKKRLQKAQKMKPRLPKGLKAKLRPYQRQGFDWLARSAAWGVGVCLADDMGLGKTVQILSLLLSRSKFGPSLVVAPTSVCSNWRDEVQKFVPNLKVIILHEVDREVAIRSVGPGEILVTSYGLLCTNLESLKKVTWNTLVLDESQAIKNNQTQRFKAAISLKADFRIAATGTPVENHLGELWSLFRFLNPGLLGAQKSFATRYANDMVAQSNLKDLIAPFLLRRLKENVLKDLPPKTDITLKVEPSRQERLFYESVRLNAMDRIENSEKGGLIGILAELMKIRRACCHPKLVDPKSTIPSSKLERFKELVIDLHQAGHKILVFSQFVDHLKILEKEIKKLKLSYQYLDGSTSPKKRAQAVKTFQSGASDIFLISLKAGGTGLNLTEANYVIHMDPWWNPATEDQASDRAHRLGQQKPVTVYRLIAADTIEEKILTLHSHKRELVDSLLEGSDRAGKLSAEELLGLLRESALVKS